MVEELVNCVTTAVYYISNPKIERKNVSWIAEVLDPFFLDKDTYQINMYGRKKVKVVTDVMNEEPFWKLLKKQMVQIKKKYPCCSTDIDPDYIK